MEGEKEAEGPAAGLGKGEGRSGHLFEMDHHLCVTCSVPVNLLNEKHEVLGL